MLADFVNGADVGMVQSRGSLRFTLETGESLCVFSNVIWQELQGHEAVKLYVFSPVDDTHPASTEFLQDTVVRDSLVDHWRESYVGELGKSMKARGLQRR